MIFECRMVEARREDGALEGIGVRWTEARTLIEDAILKVAVFILGVGLLPGLGVLAGALAGAVPLGIAVIVLVLFGGLVWGLVRASERMPGRVREVTFWRDGIMRAPLGLSTTKLPNNEGHLPLPSILSIEKEQLITPKGENPSIYTHGVLIFYHSGYIEHIAQYLAPDQAHMLAVCLTRALAELREDMTSVGAAAMHSYASGSGEAQLID